MILQRKATYWCFLVDGFNDKLLVVKGNISDFAPRESDFRGHSEKDKENNGKQHQLDQNLHETARPLSYFNLSILSIVYSAGSV